MEIKKTFILEHGNYPTAKRFAKVYLCNNRYFLQVAAGAIKEITDSQFDKLCNGIEVYDF